MPKSKAITVIVILFVLSVGFYLFNKLKTPKVTERVYTHETVTESTGTLSPEFPTIPVYQGLTLDKSYKREQDGKTDFSAFYYFDFEEEKIPEVYKWYIDELKKAGWKVEGPFVDEAEDELAITGENNLYVLRIYNSEREEGDSGGRAGNYISVDLKEK